jgi:hypothetical protein
MQTLPRLKAIYSLEANNLFLAATWMQLFGGVGMMMISGYGGACLRQSREPYPSYVAGAAITRKDDILVVVRSP